MSFMDDDMHAVEYTQQLSILNKRNPCERDLHLHTSHPYSISLEPFAEPLRPTSCSDASAYRIGYRVADTHEVLTAVEVPAKVIAEVLLAEASLVTTITANGRVISSMSGLGDGAQRLKRIVPSIDELVGQTIEERNLRLEEASTTDLRTLLATLNRSVCLVKRALSRIESSRDGSDSEC